jgi:hypothetical protein
MPKIGPGPTPKAFAEAWAKDFTAAVTTAAGKDGRLSITEARRIAERVDALKVFSDNAVNYLNAKGQKTVAIKTLIDAGKAYVEAQAKAAAGPDGRISATDATKLKADLYDDFRMLRGIVTYPAPPLPSVLKGDLRDHALTALDSGAMTLMSAPPASVRGRKPEIERLEHKESNTHVAVWVAQGQVYLQRGSQQAGTGLVGWWHAGPVPALNTGRGELRSKLEAATKDMWNTSDRDARVRFISSPGLGPTINAAAVKARFKATHDLLAQSIYDSQSGGVSTLASRTQISEQDANAWLENRSNNFDPADPESVKQANKWGQLKAILNAELTDLKLFRFASPNGVEVSTFIVGRTKNGDLAGVLTASIET